MDNHPPTAEQYLQKLVASAEYQGRVCRACIIILFALIPLLAALGIYTTYGLSKPKPVEPIDWYDVTVAIRQADLDKALKHANELLVKVPRDFEGHYRKGEILLMLGDKPGARSSFAAAYEIFPIYKYKSAVEAMEK